MVMVGTHHDDDDDDDNVGGNRRVVPSKVLPFLARRQFRSGGGDDKGLTNDNQRLDPDYI